MLQIPGAGNAVAVSIDGDGRRVACGPYAAWSEAVLSAPRTFACVAPSRWD